MGNLRLVAGSGRGVGDLAPFRGASTARAERLLPPLSIVCVLSIDVLIVLSAYFLAHWLRFVAPEEGPPALGMEHYVRLALTVSLGTAALLATHSLYDLNRPRAWSWRLQAIVSAVSTALVVCAAGSFFLGDQGFSRLWIAAGWAFAVVGLTIWRTLAGSLYAAARAAFAPANRVLIVGANPLGEELGQALSGRFCVVGYVDNGTDGDRADTLPLLGPIADLDRVVQAHAVDEIIIVLPAHRREQLSRVIARGFHRQVQVRFAPELGDVLPRQFEIRYLAGRPYISFAPVARVSWLKRATDLAVSSLGLVALLPLLIVIALAIKLDSAGPILYRQRRVGKHGQYFQLLKFRSMRSDAEQSLAGLQRQNEASGPLFKIRADPRVTRVGRVLRRWSLDELPQLVNVVRGEMSLVGPRPPLPSEVDQYEDWQHGRLRAVPGVTGLWQVSGRSEVPFHDMVRLDLHYIRNWSLALDLEILLRTIPAVVTSRGAY